MAIITFLSDFGLKDHYVAAVKAKILSTNPSIQLVDISHQVIPGDIGGGSFLLKSVYKSFPQGTVHLIGVDEPYGEATPMIAVKSEEYFFVGPDNGLIGLVTESPNYIATQIVPPSSSISSFPCRDILAPVAANLASGKSISEVGKPIDSFKKMINRQLRASKAQIIGNVIHIDNYGNLITNIDRKTFEFLSSGKDFHISFGREYTKKIQEGYHSVEPGDCFVIFNSLDYLEIGIKQGKASSLLGMQMDSTVIVNLQDK